MRVPCRVLRGSGGSGGSYLHDAAFSPMTQVSGGIGGLLVDNNLFDLPTVTLTVSDFDAYQAYLVGRKAAFDSLAACETCPEQLAKAIGEQVGLDLEHITTAAEWATLIVADLRADATG